MQHWPDMGYVHRQEILHSLKAFLRICFADQLRGGSRAAATSKMERFVIIVNGFQPFLSLDDLVIKTYINITLNLHT